MKFHIPTALREFAAGRSQVEIEHQAGTLNSALSLLWTICPGMRDRVLTEQGEVRRHINIFVGEENIRYTGGLATLVSAESVISIVPAVSGGASACHIFADADPPTIDFPTYERLADPPAPPFLLSKIANTEPLGIRLPSLSL